MDEHHAASPWVWLTCRPSAAWAAAEFSLRILVPRSLLRPEPGTSRTVVRVTRDELQSWIHLWTDFGGYTNPSLRLFGLPVFLTLAGPMDPADAGSSA